MSYNKARAERNWRIWKDTEEKQMRQLGVDEDTIEELRAYDWDAFKSERRHCERFQDVGAYLDALAADEPQPEFRTVEEFLDNIENERLYSVLLTADKLTLQIAVMKTQDYTTAEIAAKLNLTPKSVYRRMDRLKVKIKNC